MTEKREKTTKNKYEFQSEVKQLLNILVFSLYKHKEVFLRELISNATDALNKVQFAQLVENDIEDKEIDLKIDIIINKKEGKLTIEDTGIGMTKDELINNIGTIAHSGAIDFINKAADLNKDEKIDLIGKFGVGFYSSFMVAEEIRIYTKSYKKGSSGYLWSSKGDNSYTITKTDKETRGTKIELTLKKEEKEFLDKLRVKNIIETHSKFTPFPINIESEKIESAEALWTQPKSKLKEKDYTEFYKFIEGHGEDPEAYIHISSDAPVQFNSILFIPKSNFELFGISKKDPGIDLYSNKVLIDKGSKDIIPEYLRFIAGIVDSEELPLNISRESIQSNVKIDKIRKHLVKKILEKMKLVKNKNFEKYLNIWKNFNKNLKEGIINEFSSREKLAELLLFSSSKTAPEKFTDLEKYMGSMEDGKNEIYFVSGTDLSTIEKNPALEIFRKKEIEVLYLTDPMDEFVLEHLREYKGKLFKQIESADIKLEEKTESGQDEEYMKDVNNFIGYLKVIYGDKISKIEVSKRLIDSPCVLLNPSDGPSVQMEKIMKMVNKEYNFSKRTFEINPGNKLIKQLVKIHKSTPDSESLKILSLQLLDNMILREGVLDGLDEIIPRIQEIMMKAAGNN